MELLTPLSPRCRASRDRVGTYEVVEFTIEALRPMEDPFRSVTVRGTAEIEGSLPTPLVGFCDSIDGSVYRVRWMPTQSGSATVTLEIEGTDLSAQFAFPVEVVASGSKGMVKADGWGFKWSESGEPFFWNATTAYMLAGLREDVMVSALERLAAKGINRIRVALSPTRQRDGGRWYEGQVTPREDFTFFYGPWPSRRPDSHAEPDFDVTRFDVAYWQKFERMLAHAQRLGILVQVIFFVDAQEPQNYPFDRERFGDDPDEIRYFQYGAARLGSFANVEWCLTNEWALYRPDEWVERIGALLSTADPYGHLCSVHGHGHFPFRASPWVTHTQFQVWDEHGAYDWVLQQRAEQETIGRPLPIVNEEYGYEDHYPGPWGEGRVAPARSGDSRRRLAWEITFAGGHQTTGESAENGLGGWINGLGNDEMTMLDGYQHLRAFFEKDGNAFIPAPNADLAPVRIMGDQTGKVLVYCPNGEALPPLLLEGKSVALTYNPRTGEYGGDGDTSGDWVYLLQ